MMWSDRQAQAGHAKGAGVLAEPLDGECAEIAAIAAAPEIPVARAQSASGSCELHILVRYTLREYTSFMWEHGGYLIHRRRIRWPASLYMRVKSTTTAALNFMLLRRGRRSYEFTIDEFGIVRTSDTGVTLIEWGDVLALRSYSPGLMMVLKRGTLPIPFRCLSGQQVEALRTLAAARKAGEEQA